jgi:3-hydroxybutyryl-CoA dehydratase
MISAYFDELVEGAEFESARRTVTETDVVQFAGLSGDFHPLHTDEIHSRQSQFGSRIAHGMLTLAIASGLVTLSRDSVRAFYGMDKVRFLRPVAFGDTLFVRSRVACLEQSTDDNGIVTLGVVVINQDDNPVVAMDMKFLVASRASDTGITSSRST